MRPWRDATEYRAIGARFKKPKTTASMRPWRDATEYGAVIVIQQILPISFNEAVA